MNKYKFLIFTLLSVAIILCAGFVSSAQSAVNLGTAGDFVILSKAGISTTGTTSITGDIGVSPIDQTAITGFDLIGVPTTDTFLTSALVTGKIYAADLVSPTPSKMTTAVSDMEIAYTDAAGRTETSIITELGAGDITSMTLAPGLYKWGTGVLISSAGVTLSGSSTDVWIFQVGEDLTVASGAIVTLSGGAQAKNIFWQVAGQTTLETTSQFKGIILCQTAIAINTGATLNGRALAQTAVTLDANAVTSPGTASSSPPVDESDSGSDSSGSSGGSHSSGSGSSGSGSSGSGSSKNTTVPNKTITPPPVVITPPDTSGAADVITPGTKPTLWTKIVDALKSPLGKKILIGIGVLVLIWLGYLLFRPKSPRF